MFIAGGTYVAIAFPDSLAHPSLLILFSTLSRSPLVSLAKLKHDYIWLWQFLKQFFLLFVHFFSFSSCFASLLWRMRGLLNLIKFLWLI